MKISIIIPNYNYAEYIGQTIESVLSQNHDDIEIIVIDDGSTDNSFEIIEGYRQKYPETIRSVKQQNMGQARAINNGLRLATGDIVGWINSDDTYCKNVFSEVVEAFSKNRKTDIAFGDINIIDVNGRFIYKQYDPEFSYLISVFTGFANNISSNAVFWRKSLLDTVGFLDPEYKCGLDNEYFSRLTHRKHVVHLRKTIANFRRQVITKAAINHKDWNSLVKEEAYRVFYQSFNQLKLSHYLSFKTANKLKPLFVAYRRFQKMVSGAYFKNFIERWRYKRNSEGR